MADKKIPEPQIKEMAKAKVAEMLKLTDEGTLFEEKDIIEYGAYKYAVEMEIDGELRYVTIVLTTKNAIPTAKQLATKGGAFDPYAEREMWIAEKERKAKEKEENDAKKQAKIAKDKARREAAKAKAEKGE